MEALRHEIFGGFALVLCSGFAVTTKLFVSSFFTVFVFEDVSYKWVAKYFGKNLNVGLGEEVFQKSAQVFRSDSSAPVWTNFRYLWLLSRIMTG